MNDKVCKFFQQGNCKFTSETCRFKHVEETNGKQTGVTEQGQGTRQGTGQEKGIGTGQEKGIGTKQGKGIGKETGREIANQIQYQSKKNTETFEPYYGPSDMRVVVEIAEGKKRSELEFQTNDIALIPDLFRDEKDIFTRLNMEMEKYGDQNDQLWKLWHGDSHVIADDGTDFKKHCPTFNFILDRIREYFQMDIKATRFNLYRDDNDHKPFHFDASAIKPEKAKIQNITIGVSFGRTREIAFEDALEPKKHRRVVSFPMTNGSTYCFCKDINVNWRHGVPAIPKEQFKKESRISIIAWGWVDQKNLK
jgi:hypothetical protein